MSQSKGNVRPGGGKDRQTLFYRTLPAKARDPTTSFPQMNGGNTPNLVLKIFPTNPTLQENITILRLK